MDKSIIKQVIDRITPKRLKLYYQSSVLEKYRNLLSHGTISYSQEGEDLILQRIFENKNSGFYVDVGAHHPKRFSNTYLFYQKGWRGINIDPMPGVMKHFDKLRPRDINLEVAISDRNENQSYFIFNEPALNTFSKDVAHERDGVGNYKIIQIVDIKTIGLGVVLDSYMPNNQHIDFLSVDVEGFDLNVLKSNNWTKYKPEIVLAEATGSTIESLLNSEIYRYLSVLNYVVLAKTSNTIVFIYNNSRI